MPHLAIQDERLIRKKLMMKFDLDPLDDVKADRKKHIFDTYINGTHGKGFYKIWFYMKHKLLIFSYGLINGPTYRSCILLANKKKPLSRNTKGLSQRNTHGLQ